MQPVASAKKKNMKKTVIVATLLISAVNINAQKIIGRTVDIAKDVVGVFTPAEPSATTYSKGFPGYEPVNPDGTGEAAPIVESILGIFGLGGVYAWRLIKRKKTE